VRLLSAGPLVEFSGFRHLIAACAQLRSRGLDFTCEIIGDGPLREALQAQITEENLRPLVTLTGSATQQELLEKLRSCDIFTLAAIVDAAGATDAFPAVILDAMASSTRRRRDGKSRGIPWRWCTAAPACSRLWRQPHPRETARSARSRSVVSRGLGNADARGWSRTSRSTRRLSRWSRSSSGGRRLLLGGAKPLPAVARRQGRRISNRSLPEPERRCWKQELLEMEKDRACPVVRSSATSRRRIRQSGPVSQHRDASDVLPDPMVVEAEWQQNQALAHELENDRANEKHRPPSALFLQQARYAIALRSRLAQHKISHLHATSSRALICGVMLKKLTGLTLSATIEANPQLQVRTLRSALAHCDGGRVSDPKLSAHLSSSFLLEPAGGATLLPKFGVGSKRHNSVWQKWAELLESWRLHRR
jgi:hypothetical protein